MTRAKCRQMLGALILVVTTGVARADTIQVKMEKLGFVPVEISAHVGDTIEWVQYRLCRPYGHRAEWFLGRLDPSQCQKDGGSQDRGGS